MIREPNKAPVISMRPALLWCDLQQQTKLYINLVYIYEQGSERLVQKGKKYPIEHPFDEYGILESDILVGLRQSRIFIISTFRIAFSYWYV